MASPRPYLAHTPVALAHRGGALYAPNVGLENTLTAFGNAVAIDTETLGWIIERATNTHLATLLSRELWQPMGMEFDADITLAASRCFAETPIPT